MNEEPLALLCSGCERPIREGARFCPSCGRTHDAPPPGEPIESLPASAPLERTSLRAVVLVQWRELTRIAWLYGLMLLASLVLGWVSRVDPSPWPTLAVMVFDALLVVGYAAARPREIAELLRLPRASGAQLVRIAGATVGCTLVLIYYFTLIQRAGMPMLELTAEYKEHAWPAWSVFVMLSIMPGLFEELGFRGVIHSTLERVLSAREALIIQAALFSIVHLSPVIFASHFLMGFYLGWLRNETRSLYPGMLAHACWNAYWVAEELYGAF